MENDEIIKALSELLAKLDLPIDGIDVSEVAGHTLFTVRTKESGVLIGAGGETLHALNHLMKKFFEKGSDDAGRHFIVDVNGYHLKHIQALEGQAKMLAERARTFKYDVEMSPMSPYDRLIVHASLSDSPDIATESQGEGKLRHIVIRYTGTASATAPSAEL